MGYLLDIFWITDQIPDDIANPMQEDYDGDKGLPAALYGALKRSSDWHGAQIHVLETKTAEMGEKNVVEDLEGVNFLQQEVGAKITSMNKFLTKSDCFSACQPKKCFSDRLVWRGSLGFYDETDSSLCVRRLRGFEMFAKDDKSVEMFNQIHGGNSNGEPTLISRTLKIITKCDVNTIPVYLLSGQQFYLTVLDNKDEVYEHFLQSDGEFFGDSGVIAKMDCLPIQGNTRVKSDCKLTFEYWKQYITSTHTYEESVDQLDVFESEQEHSLFARHNSNPSGQDSSNYNMQSLYFLILDDVGGGLQGGEPYDDGRYTKLCILLDPSAAEGGGQLKSYNKMQDSLQLKFEEEQNEMLEEKQKLEEKLKKLSIVSHCNAPKLFTFIRQVQSAVLGTL